MTIFYNKPVATQDSLSLWFFREMSNYFNCGSIHKDVTFVFTETTFYGEIIFVKLFSKCSKGYIWISKKNRKNLALVEALIQNIEPKKYGADNLKCEITFIFNKTTFEGYPNFDNLRCHKLSFSNTIFKKGARFRHIDVDEMLFEPRELSADATFFHREKADIENGILRGKEIGKIGKFKYRHQLEGDGTTFLIGMRFTEKAEFTDCVLDKVQFSYLDEDSLLKCYFANSVMGEAIFYNCTFPFNSNAITQFHFIEDKPKILAFFSLLVMPIAIFGSLFFVGSIIELMFYILLAASPLMVILGGSLFNSSYFMPLMKFFEKIIDKTLELKINRHIATGDDYIAAQNISPEQNKINRETVREVYRQLKINYDNSGDHQKAGEFYYSQRYWEMAGGSKNLFGYASAQLLLTEIHHWINGFGERWLRAFVWFWMVVVAFAFLLKPNIDYISTPNTPSFLLKPQKIENGVEYFNKNIAQLKTEYEKKINELPWYSQPFIGKSSINFENNASIIVLKTVENNGSISNKVCLPLNEWSSRFVYSFDKLYTPLRFSPQSSWFEATSTDINWLGILETILLWFFLGSFIAAVKNRIRR